MTNHPNSPDMFSTEADRQAALEAPLAARMRPKSFTEFIGQDHLVGERHTLRRAIESDQVPSMILWGPPGSGKTTLSRLIANLTRSHFASVSAVASGVADIRHNISEAKNRRGLEGKRTILFIDEIHRFNKAQQDVILPHVEDGVITLIGATTENPSFEIISPLLSRCRVFTLRALAEDQIEALLRHALTDVERGLGKFKVGIDDKAIIAIAKVAAGDARMALNVLELAAVTAQSNDKGEHKIALADVKETLQNQFSALYDKSGDHHYDTISAFIKSLRGSDPDAALYWLARMLEAGEEPLFIARRLAILAAEDVGLADPQALTVAMAAQQAVHFVGMPEGFYPLAEATIYLAVAPKSNSIGSAYGLALNDARATSNEPIPLHLRNPVTKLMNEAGYGRDYKYDHSFPENYSGQHHMPARLIGHSYYVPGTNDHEQQIAARLKILRKKRKGND